PFKNWKISDEDYRNREKWGEYEDAIDDMFEETDTKHAPWHLVPSNKKWVARVTVCETAVKALSRALDCDCELPKGWRELDQ
ncbi:partial Polyphosphate:AMP phosphotransferase, partial [Planctomycetaceae bacterium]